VCTEFFDLALVLERNENQTLPLHEFAQRHPPTRGRPTLQGLRGPLAARGGHSGACERVSRAGRALCGRELPRRGRPCQRHSGVFLSHRRGCGRALPLSRHINITEDRASHSAKIQQEIQMHAHFSLHDIVHHSIYAQTVLASG